MMTVDMTQLHRLAPEDAALITIFTTTNLDNSTTIHKVNVPSWLAVHAPCAWCH
jgi:hypothetical protein